MYVSIREIQEKWRFRNFTIDLVVKKLTKPPFAQVHVQLMLLCLAFQCSSMGTNPSVTQTAQQKTTVNVLKPSSSSVCRFGFCLLNLLNLFWPAERGCVGGWDEDGPQSPRWSELRGVTGVFEGPSWKWIPVWLEYRLQGEQLWSPNSDLTFAPKPRGRVCRGRTEMLAVFSPFL